VILNGGRKKGKTDFGGIGDILAEKLQMRAKI